MDRLPSDQRLSRLTTPGFLGALWLLVANDVLFKAWYGNWVTGKLSDFAGLIAFALFWTAILPSRRSLVHVLCGLAFVLWKSPLSESFITLWNASLPWRIDRVVDPTDAFALMVLPLSWWYAGVARPLALLRPLRAVVGVAAVVSFVATSAPRETTPDGTVFVVPMPQGRVSRELEAIDSADSTLDIIQTSALSMDTLMIHFGETIARVELRYAATGETLLTLVEVTSRTTVPEPVANARRELSEKVVSVLRHKDGAPVLAK
jgi:hypothetical protein